MTAFGQIRGQIRIDAAKAIAQYAALRAANASTVTALRSASTTLIGVGAAAVTAGAGLLALFGKAVTAAATFEKKIDFFGAVTDASQKDMEAVAKKALEMGKTTIFSANQMADAFVEFGKAGVNTQDIIGGVADSVASLAAAADISLTQASDIIISTMQTFKIGAGGTAQIANLLAGAANSSIVDVTDLGVSLKYVGGIAAATGIPLKSVITALSLLGQAGIKGSTAGTSLRQILVSLNATSAKAQKTLKSLGIITKDNNNLFIDQAGHLKPLDQIFQILKDHTAKLTDAQRLSALKIIFNNRALAAANILLKDGAKGFSDMSTAIDKVTANDVAHKRLDNLAGDWLRLKNTVQTYLIQAGTPFQDNLRKIVQGLTDLVKWFGNLNPHLVTAIFATIAIVGALLLFNGIMALSVGIILRMVIALKNLRLVFLLLRGIVLLLTRAFIAFTIALLTNPVFAIITAVLVLIAAFVILFIKVKGFRDFFIRAGKDIAGAFIAVVNFFKGLPAFFEGVWKSITSGVTKAWDAVKNAFTTAVNAIKSFLNTVWKGIIDFIVTPIKDVVNSVIDAWNTIYGIFSRFIGNIIAFISRNWRVIILLTGPIGIAIDIITAQWAKISAVFSSAINSILVIVKFVWGLIVSTITSAVNSIYFIVKTSWDALVVLATTVFNGIKTVIVPIINAIVTFFQFQFNLMKTIVTTQWNAIVVATRFVWGLIKAAVQAAVNGILAVIRTLSQIAGIVGNAFRSAYNAIVGVVNTILGYLRGFVGKVLAAIGNVTAPMARVGKDMISGLYNAILDAMSAVWNFFRGLLGTILRQIGDPLQFLYDVGRAMIQGMINGIESMVSSAVGAVKNAVGGVIKGAKSLLGINSPSKVFHGFGMGIMEGLRNGMMSNQAMVDTALNSLNNMFTGKGMALNTTFAATRMIGGPQASGVATASPAPVVVKGGDSTYHVTVQVQTLKDVQHLLDIFDDIPKTAGANS